MVLGGFLVFFVVSGGDSFVSRWYLGGVSVVSRWCLGGVLVVSWW